MAQLTDSTKIETYLCVSSVIATEIAKRLRLAEVYLRNLKGGPWYDALLALQSSDPTDQAVLDSEEAESLIAFYFGLPHLNLRIDDSGGILLQEWTDVLGGKLQKLFTTMRTIEPIRKELLSQAKCLVYDGPVIDYEDADQTRVEGVREVGPTTGLALSAIATADGR